MSEVITISKNRLLLLFPEEVGKNEMNRILGDIFDQNFTFDEPIIRDIPWETKYYRTSLDLYVDRYEEFGSWCKDFMEEECYELRKEISGIISFFNCKNLVENIEIFKEIIESMKDDNEKIYIGCNAVGLRDVEIDSDFITLPFSDENLEVVTWNIEKNNQDDRIEKEGLERIKEIIDVHPWKNMEKLLSGSDGLCVPPSSSDNGKTLTEFDSLRNRLEGARNKYHSISSQEEKAEFLNSVIDALSDMLL